jgi:hypothetical protein
LKLNIARDTARKRAVLAGIDFGFPRLWPASRAEQLVVGALISLAVAVRITYYLSNPSLSVDEADLALNLMHRSYSGLLGQLDFNQAAPPGFLLLQKLVVNSVGTTPYALRLVPLVAGIASSFLIFPVATQFIGRRAAIVALALFAVSDPLVSFASMNKQYSVDVGVAVGLYAVALALLDRRGVRPAVILAFSGCIAVWLSHPAAFVLAGIGTTLIIERMKTRRWREATDLLPVITAWLVSFISAYLLARSSVAQIQHSIAPAAGNSTLLGNDGQPGVLQTYGGIVRYLLGIPMFGHAARTVITLVAISVALIGVIVVWRSRPTYAAFLVLPAGFALIVTAVNLYPRYSRTFLFLSPAMLVLVARGGFSLAIIERSRFIRVGAAAALAALVGTTTYATIDYLRSRREAEPVEALRYLAHRARDGDSLYLYLTSQYTFRYYVECGCFGPTNAVQRARRLWPIRPASGHAQFAPALKSAPPRLIAGGSTSQTASNYRQEFKPLQGKDRVWVLVIDPSPASKVAVTTFLSQAGMRRESFPRSGRTEVAYLWLYDLR